MTKIEWSDKTLNHIAGCTKVSAGCANCYAEKMSVRQNGFEQKRCFYSTPQKLAEKDLHYFNVVSGGKFNGKIHIRADWDRLMKPLEWKKPKMVFVNSMADTFHPDVPDEYIDRLWLMMALCSSIQRYRYPDGEEEPVGKPYGHCFQVLTKRPERLYSYLSARSLSEIIQDATKSFGDGMGEWEDWVHWNIENHEVLPNVWLGVTAENQETADERIPLLLKTPAAIKFISAEPLLEAVDFRKLLIGSDACPVCDGSGILTKWISGVREYSSLVEGVSHSFPCPTCQDRHKIHWLICGGESGSKARPFDMDWARSIKNQCVKAGVKFFLKQRNGWVKREVPKDKDVFCNLTNRFLSYGDSEFYWDYHKSALDENGKRINKFKMPKLDGQIWDQYPEIWRPK